MSQEATAATVADAEVLLDVRDHIATITLNAPQRMNTISGPMLDLLAKTLVEVDANPDVRVVILTGAGRAFCAGLDLGGAKQGSTGMSGASSSTTIGLRDTPPTVLHNMDTPVICALNGGAAGYGMDLAMGCDIRIMGEGGKLAAAFTKRGLLPESGGTWILPRLLGWAKAAELVFTGRTLGGADCLELGLVNKVVADAEVQDAARAMAEEIAANAPLAVRAAKRMMRMGLKEPFDEHVHHVFLQLLPLLKTEDFGEGIRAFMEKRTPNFTGK
ncbi:enoyl-CoA hydratase/isomerase family protein [Iodidimonas sp. SYSU 1G8]|uniref:enoyl-CoA hydratase/isomerase family protein n=1 Tax=Iodidimonas sp. SYSU 1G8 TaxID=3133967 RepID=UPI0031FEC42E